MILMRHKRKTSRCLVGGLGSALFILSGCLPSQTSRDGFLTPFWSPGAKSLSAQNSVASIGTQTAATFDSTGRTTASTISNGSTTATSTASGPVTRTKVTKPKTPTSAESPSVEASSTAAASPTSPAAQTATSSAQTAQATETSPTNSPTSAVQLVSAEVPIPTRDGAKPSSSVTSADGASETGTPVPANTAGGQPEASRLSDFVAPNRVAPLPAPNEADSPGQDAANTSGESPSGEPNRSTVATSDSDPSLRNSALEPGTELTGIDPSTAEMESESSDSADAKPLGPERLAANLSTRSAAASDELAPWREHLRQSIEALELQLAMEDLDEGEQSRLEGVLRLMYIAANRPDDAIASLERLPASQRQFWKYGVAGFLELLAPQPDVPLSRQAKMALRQLRSACHELATLASLEVRNLAFCRRVESFGRYTEFEPYEFFPEQEVILYTEVGNFVVEELPHGYESELVGSYQIFDEKGRHIGDFDLPVDKQISRHIRTDYFLPYRVYLPRALAEGNYTMQVTMQDKKGKKFGQTEPVAFRIRHE